MKEQLLTKIDTYLRSPDTTLAKTVHRIAPETGIKYRISWKKKVIDKSIALPMAVTSTLPIGALAIAKRIEDGNPAFYKSPRIGKYGIIFDVNKIRSLRKGADENHEMNIANALTAGIPDDPRSTRLGRWMRKWNIDELPQLWQVVRGDMALIGMRAADELSWKVLRESRSKGVQELFTQYIASEPAAINPQAVFGKKGTPDEQYFYNALYARKASLGFDLYILFRTFSRHFLNKK